MDNKPLIQCFQDELEKLIEKYEDQGLTLGETIGVLEIVKLNIYNNMIDEDLI